MNLTTLFDEAVARKASDIHLSTGEVPCLRIAGDLVRLDCPALNHESFAALMEPTLTTDAWARIRAGQPVERTINLGDRNFSLIAFRIFDNGFAATFRIISAEVPNLDQIGEGAMELMETIAGSPRGLVLIAGPTGSGKVTTAGAIVQRINMTRSARVFVIANGPAFTFRSDKAMVTQISIGQDFQTYEAALEATHHADPDVIAVDDIPNSEALRQIVILAETGHLVLANIHADSVSDVLRKVFDAARTEAIPLRRALAQNLIAVTVQRLFTRANGPGRVPAYEWIVANNSVKSAILHGDLDRLNHLQSTDSQCRSLQATLEVLIEEGKVTLEDAAPFLGQ